MFRDTEGIPVNDFIQQYGTSIRGQDILYVVKTNLEEDNIRATVNTRRATRGVNVKIGKSEGLGEARLKSYTHMNSNATKRFKQSGVRVLYVKVFPRRTTFQSGKRAVVRFETALKRLLKSSGHLVSKRGSELFRIEPSDSFDIIENLNIDELDEPLRISERIGMRVVWLTKDTVTGKIKLHKHPDYDRIIRDYGIT